MFFEACAGEKPMTNCSRVFERHIVAPLPYMTERAPRGLTALQADNMPMEVEEQTKMLEGVYGDRLPINPTYAQEWPRYAQQFEKFKAFLAAKILPAAGGFDWAEPPTTVFKEALERGLPETMRHEDHGKSGISFGWKGGSYTTGPSFTKDEWEHWESREVNIAVVGHNQMMMEYCQQGELPKPNNNAVLEKLLFLEASTDLDDPSSLNRLVLRELGDKCALVMDAPNGADSMKALVEADVATCTTPFQVSKFLGLQAGGAGEDTPCVRLAAKEDAFEIMQEFLAENQEDKKVRQLKREFAHSPSNGTAGSPTGEL